MLLSISVTKENEERLIEKFGGIPKGSVLLNYILDGGCQSLVIGGVPKIVDNQGLLDKIYEDTQFIVESIKKKNTDQGQKGDFDKPKDWSLILSDKQIAYGNSLVENIKAGMSEDGERNLGDYRTKDIEKVIPNNVMGDLREYVLSHFLD